MFLILMLDRKTRQQRTKERLKKKENMKTLQSTDVNSSTEHLWKLTVSVGSGR